MVSLMPAARAAFMVSCWPVAALNLAQHLSADKYQALESLAEVLTHVEKFYVDPESAEFPRIIQSAIAGVMSQLDPHSGLLTADDVQTLQDGPKQFGGIGVVIQFEGDRLLIVTPVEDSPALRAGLQAGDEIKAIDGTPVRELGPERAVERMREQPGTRVKLTIFRGGTEFEVEIEREIIRVRSLEAHPLEPGIWHVRLAAFIPHSAKKLAAVLDEAEKQAAGLRGLILDLRDNPGGLLREAVDVVDLFVGSGLIVSTVGRDPSQVEREFAHLAGTRKGFPIIVLVNEGSASASEIVAGALQDHRRAVIMGAQTFGKGSVQSIISLADGSALKLTVARYFTPLGRSIQATGITPDIALPARPPKPESRPREADLAGHIDPQTIAPAVSQPRESPASHWPQALRRDHQVRTAYSYLKSWSIFDAAPPVTPAQGLLVTD